MLRFNFLFISLILLTVLTSRPIFWIRKILLSASLNGVRTVSKLKFVFFCEPLLEFERKSQKPFASCARVASRKQLSQLSMSDTILMGSRDVFVRSSWFSKRQVLNWRVLPRVLQNYFDSWSTEENWYLNLLKSTTFSTFASNSPALNFSDFCLRLARSSVSQK